MREKKFLSHSIVMSFIFNKDKFEKLYKEMKKIRALSDVNLKRLLTGYFVEREDATRNSYIKYMIDHHMFGADLHFEESSILGVNFTCACGGPGYEHAYQFVDHFTKRRLVISECCITYTRNFGQDDECAKAMREHRRRFVHEDVRQFNEFIDKKFT